MKQSITFIFLLAILLLANAALQMVPGGVTVRRCSGRPRPLWNIWRRLNTGGKRNDAKRTISALLSKPGD